LTSENTFRFGMGISRICSTWTVLPTWPDMVSTIDVAADTSMDCVTPQFQQRGLGQGRAHVEPATFEFKPLGSQRLDRDAVLAGYEVCSQVSPIYPGLDFGGDFGLFVRNRHRGAGDYRSRVVLHGARDVAERLGPH